MEECRDGSAFATHLSDILQMFGARAWMHFWFWSKIGRARTGPRTDALSTQNLTEFQVKPVYSMSVMWFEGRCLILCSAAGHSVWEMIATNN